MAEAKDELRGLMRRIRQLGPEQRDDFEINEQGAIREQLDPIKNGIALAGLFITGLALFVGAIGIMNITYVSVKERTREIGTRKALGARRRTILLQFLIEAVCICLVGGVAGLALAGALSSIVATVAPSFPLGLLGRTRGDRAGDLRVHGHFQRVRPGLAGEQTRSGGGLAL
jgi:putative ABC transport system permease protein